jgi:hypothetical protein
MLAVTGSIAVADVSERGSGARLAASLLFNA